MVSKRNLFVKRTGVSFTAKEADADAEAEADACLRGAHDEDDEDDDDDDDEGNKHLLYIVAVGRLNGIILQR